MELTKIVGIGIIGVIAAITVKTYRAELGMCIALATGSVILWNVLPDISRVFSELSDMCEDSGVPQGYFSLIIKVTGVAYITQFSAELAKDAGERAIAKKLEFAGKVSVLCLIMPVVKNLLDIITNTLMSF